MAFGFPASFTATVTTVGSREETRSAVIGVFQALGWEYRALDPDRYEVRFPLSGFSHGETLTVELTGENTITTTSKCSRFQIFDGGKNRQNVNQFISRFSPR